MSLQRAEEYLKKKGYADRIIIPEQSSATVEEAAAALGCEPGMIAKTLSFLQGEQPVLILAEGTARIDNSKYKARFGCKAKMIPADKVPQAFISKKLRLTRAGGDGLTIIYDPKSKDPANVAVESSRFLFRGLVIIANLSLYRLREMTQREIDSSVVWLMNHAV